MIRLRSFDQTPPGGFPYHQHGPISKRFPSVPLIEHQAKLVSAFRKGNGLPRASLGEALEDISTYNCARLGAGNSWCVDADAPLALGNHQIAGVVAGGCAGCGATV